MRRFAIATALATCCAGWATAGAHLTPAPAAPSRSPAALVPDTPAGQMFTRWLAAFNTGKLETLEAFAEAQFAPSALVERSARQRAESDRWLYLNLGPMDIVRIDTSNELNLTATVNQQLVEGFGHVTIRVDSQPPYRLLSRSVSFFEAPPSGLTTARRPTDAALARTVDQFARKLVKADVFSGVVLVGRRDRPVLNAAYGLARKDPAVPNSTGTRFQLGSVSKMFTAVAIVQFVERGELSFEDSVASVLPDFPNATSAKRITVRQLLMHSSGLPDYFFSPRYRELQLALLNPADYWPTFAHDPLRFEPGSRWEYSSSNYVVLGAIVERLARRSFRNHIADHVFRRAGMQATSYQEGLGPEPRAIGFTRFGPGRRPNLEYSTPVAVTSDQLAGPAGGGVSTTTDLFLFARALLSGKLVSHQMVDLITRDHIPAEGGGWGLGFETHEWNGVRFVGHNGFFDGAFNQVDMYPGLAYTVVVLSNTDMSGAGAIANKLRLLLTARSPTAH